MGGKLSDSYNGLKNTRNGLKIYYPTREYIVRETTYPDATKQEAIVELVRCKDCKSYEEVHWEKVDKFPVIVANHVCMKWGKGCQTDPDGYCFLAERKDGDHEG